MAKRERGLRVLFRATGFCRETGRYGYKEQVFIVFKDIPMPQNGIVDINVLNSKLTDWCMEKFTTFDNAEWGYTE